jgi:Holliday junction resolvase
MTVKAPPISEAQFQSQITQYAELRGWEWLHVRAGRTEHGWRVPVSGTMAAGWPDLVLVRGSRVLFLEVKRQDGKVTYDQQRVLDVLTLLYGNFKARAVRPSDWDFIERELS